MKNKKTLFGLSLLGSALIIAATYAHAKKPAYAANIYTESNQAENMIIHFGQKEDGSLVELERVPTGGAGTNGFNHVTGEKSAPDSLLSAGAVTLSEDHRLLFAVNAGDNSVSSFTVDKNGNLKLKDRQSTGEKGYPNSLTYNDRTKTLYTLHSFGPHHIRTFRVTGGKLHNTGYAYTINTPEFSNRIPTQIISSPDNRFVLVDVLFNAPPKAGPDGPILTPSNNGTADGVVVFPVAKDGQLEKAIFNDAGAVTPFSLRFINNSNTFVNTSAAGNGALISTLSDDGKLKNSSIATVDLSAAPDGPSETCWVSISPDSKYAFVTNFGLSNLTSIDISKGNPEVAKDNLGYVKGDGTFKALAGIPTSGPNDSWVSSNGFLYQLYPNASKLVAYKINGAALELVGDYVIPYNSSVGLVGF